MEKKIEVTTVAEVPQNTATLRGGSGEKEALVRLQSRKPRGNFSVEDMAAELEAIKAEKEAEEKAAAQQYSGVAAKVMSAFTTNSQAKRNAGITDNLTLCALANLGEYSTVQKSKIEESNQPPIYMRVTSGKIMALQAWIKDILLSGEDIFTVVSEKLPTLPQSLIMKLQQAAEEFKEDYDSGFGEDPEEDPEKVQGSKLTKAQAKIIEEMIESRAIEDALYKQIQLHTDHELEKVNRQIKTDLEHACFENTLSDFIDDFCIYSAAFTKGPMISSREVITWVNGKPTTKKEYVFVDKRVSPYDIYPDAATGSLQKGFLVEHARFDREDLELLAETTDSRAFTERIINILEHDPSATPWFIDSIEAEKAKAEIKGNSLDASTGMYHTLIMYGRLSKSELEKDGILIDGLSAEIKATMVEGQLVGLEVNKDPLGRRPYYSASFHSVPGSVWGLAPAQLMEDIQKVCNSSARALTTNMGLSSGPIGEVVKERLMDQTALSTLHPLMMIQTKAPRASNEGRAVNFHTIPSVAKDLLGVYTHFEARAADVTGIPRYDTSKMQGAGSTAKGLGMLMDNTTKNIKEAIRHIDYGYIIPRMERQFYVSLMKNPQIKYTGTLSIVAHGSKVLSMKAAIEQKRKEFFALTGNQLDQETIGKVGRSVMIRTVADDCKFPEEVVPNILKVKANVAKDNEMKEREMKAKEQQAQNWQAGVESTKIQAQAMMKTTEMAQETRRGEINLKAKEHDDKVQIEVMKDRTKNRTEELKANAEIGAQKVRADAQESSVRTNAAVKIATNK